MADVLNEVVKHWKLQHTKSSEQKATPQQIAEWESQHGVVLPEDLYRYFVRLNGTHNAEQLEFGDDLISFLPLHAIVLEAQWSPHETAPNLFVFADYLISSYWWCVELHNRPSEHTRIFVRGITLKLVANSLDEFFEAYVLSLTGIHP